MKKTIRNVYAALITMTLALLTGGCKWVSPYDYNPFPNICIDTEERLTDDDGSPYCDFHMDYAYLDEKGDSIAMLINHAAQRELLGHDYADLVPQAAVDSFKNTYLRNYRQEVGELYKADVTKHGAEGIPQWYARTYSVNTFVEEGYKGIINISANYFEDMAGAHPHQYAKWLNFDANTGKLLTKKDVFTPEGVADIERMLLDKLLIQQADRYPDETLTTLEDLHKKGILQLTDMYIPDNFLLSKEKVLFLFNRYDIAPYSEGEILMELTYEEIGHCLKIK